VAQQDAAQQDPAQQDAEQPDTKHPNGDPPRWIRSVYSSGSEPDPRFTLANERTFLAWLRTAMALMAAGVGTEALVEESRYRIVLALGLLLSGIGLAVAALFRWAATERAMRHARPLPILKLGLILTATLSVAGILGILLVVTT
jgi:putative membrane protein